MTLKSFPPYFPPKRDFLAEQDAILEKRRSIMLVEDYARSIAKLHRIMDENPWMLDPSQFKMRGEEVSTKPVLPKPVLLKPVLPKPVLPKPILLKPVLRKPVMRKPVDPIPWLIKEKKQLIIEPPKPLVDIAERLEKGMEERQERIKELAVSIGKLF